MPTEPSKAPPLLLVPLDADSDAPMHQQLYERLREAILHGRLPAGARLPSTRMLATELGVSRNTVLAAFAQLDTEGYVSAARGGGTRVSSELPDDALGMRRPARPAARRAHAKQLPPDDPVVPPRMSPRGEVFARAGARMGNSTPLDAIPFRVGRAAVDVFPSRTWARLESQRWRNGTARLDTGDVAGDPQLRAAVAEYVANARGVRCSAEQVVIVTGTQQAIDLAARVLVSDGDEAWVEEPGYDGATLALTTAGATLVPVPVDTEGLDVSAGERLAPTARIAYVTPAHQFPLGSVMSARRRLALLAWARRAGAWILEDDYDAEFRYSGRPLPSLQGLDTEPPNEASRSRVLYIGTFNKTLAPGLRLGYVVIPDMLRDAIIGARALADRHPPTLAQGVLADFMRDGHYTRHLRKLRQVYAERQATLVSAVRRELDGYLTLEPDVAGLHLVAWLPRGVDAKKLSRLAASEGIEAAALSPSFRAGLPSGSPDALLLGYAAFTPREIERGVKALARAVRAM